MDAAIANRSKAAREFRDVCRLCCKHSGERKPAMVAAAARALSPLSSSALDEASASASATSEDAADVDILDIKAEAVVSLVRSVASPAKMDQVLDIINRNISNEDARALTEKLKRSISLAAPGARLEGPVAKQAHRERLRRSIRDRQRDKRMRIAR